MHGDLDRLMEERGVDWAIVSGEPDRSPALAWMLRGARVGHARVVKERGAEATLVCGDMEREEAEAAGLPIRTHSELGLPAIWKDASTTLEAARRTFDRLREELGIAGRVGLYGSTSWSWARTFLEALREDHPGIEWVREWSDDEELFERARLGKDADEVERIRAVGRRTEAIVEGVLEELSRCRPTDDGELRDEGGPVTVGRVKGRMAARAAEAGLVAEGTILAPGRQGAIPHNRGEEETVLRVGEPVILDFFPREQGGGYYWDTTRTFCVGEVPEEFAAIWETVHDAFEAGMDALQAGAPAARADEAVCDLFEARDHPTKRAEPGTREGYNHSLGHGVGLELHERPRISCTGPGSDELVPGAVVTVEPGLYYPDRGMACRLEDMVWIRPDGTVENLSTLPREPLVPLEF